MIKLDGGRRAGSDTGLEWMLFFEMSVYGFKLRARDGCLTLSISIGWG